MATAIIYAVLAVLFYSTYCVLNKVCLSRGITPGLLLVSGHLIATLLLLPTAGWSALHNFWRPEVGLIALSCLFWGVTDYLEAKAYQHTSAATSQTIGVLSMILVVLAGIVIFDEQVSLTGFIGMACILISVIAQVNPKGLEWNIGVLYRFISIFFLAAALIFDKYNATEFDPQLVPFYSFLFTTLIFLGITKKRTILEIPEGIRKTRGLLLAVPITAGAGYWLMIQALALGYLSITFAIQECCVVFIFLLEFHFLRMREQVFKRALTCSGCAFGAILLTVS